ncbi:uncharacterized protein LOC110729281 [Chenopodium quinoa]|uniref:uncharacterized protein LOC110729281 n=1 Tax=Chenopodium quinoa TaxID=63459 RepID=UPI000B76BE64|nr:uncharacterized protein LOC110729281 [Chenopodium quinoa]
MDNLDVQKRLEWMRCANRTDNLYINGVNSFLQFAFGDLETNSDLGEEEKKVPCPCNRCNNGPHKTKDEIYIDLIVNGIEQGYVRVIYHVEFKPPQKKSRNDLGDNAHDDIFRMIHDRFSLRVSNNDDIDDMLDEEQQPNEFDQPRYKKDTKEAKMFENLMRDAQQTLYPGCNEFSKLSFILKLFQIKCMDGMTNKAFTSMLHMFKNALPKGAVLPSNYCEARKIITNLGFDYEKIEACENDCMLFWKENANLEKYSICDTKRDKASPKVLRYFPLTLRLQRLFMSSKTANEMRWHSDKREDEGVLKHPADSEA